MASETSMAAAVRGAPELEQGATVGDATSPTVALEEDELLVVVVVEVVVHVVWAPCAHG